MLRSYKNIAIVFLALTVFTSLIGYVCLNRVFLSDALLPANKSVIPWELETTSDAELGGSSSVSVNDSTYSLDLDLLLAQDAEDPFIAITLAFSDLEDPKRFFDLTRYSTLLLNVKCSPRNVLAFVVPVFDEDVTEPANFISYRIPSTFFSCKEGWTEVEIDLEHLVVPQWWLARFNVELSNWDYQLDKVVGLSFGVTWQSPVGSVSNVKISELTLQGRDWRYMYVFSGVALLVWGVFAFWFFKQHKKYLIADIVEKLQKDRPLVAYQQLSIEPHKDEKKSEILRFMATEYAHPDMSLETASEKLGINRNKVNAVLREELGFTFTTYLNKLRLAEAARLLQDRDEINIAGIACSVGYNNVSYFNKLFKNEYGCTPKTFRNIYRRKKSAD